MIRWKVTKQDARDIKAITERGIRILVEAEIVHNTTARRALAFQDLEMDITACHANGCPLQLGRLRHADDANFGHDVFGIRRFIDRKTGKIPDEKFWPRFAVRTEVPA